MKYNAAKVSINAKDFEKDLMAEMDARMDPLMDGLLSEFFIGIAQKLPVEDGHAHEAFRSAGDSIVRLMGSPRRLKGVIGNIANNASGDPTARKRGVGHYSRGNRSVEALVHIDLPFVYRLEYGINIRVGDMSGNTGPKSKGVKPGTLYGKREEGTTGLLQWREGGKVKRARIRRGVPKHGFFANAINRVKNKARRKDW